MTLLETFSICTGTLGILTGGAALGRLLIVHGGDRSRLNSIEKWVEEHGVGQSEFRNLTRRVETVEEQCEATSKLMTDIRIELGRIPDQFHAQRELLASQFENVNHRINTVRSSMDGIARRLEGKSQ